jgi:hypothetical protein
MTSDSSDIDNAVVALLGADAALLAVCLNGVYMNEAPPGATRFVIVSVVDAHEEAVFGGRAFEDVLYLVEARMLEPVPTGDIKTAAARLDVLLEDQPLTVAGFGWMASYRESRERGVEPDEHDPALRWARRGGYYRVQMALAG